MSVPLPLSYNPIDAEPLNDVLQQYQGKLHHQLITDFEQALTKAIKSNYVVALNSGSAAIHMALRVLDVGPGDVVIAPTFTYVATINPILYQGAEPVFVDSEAATWNMNPELLDEALQQETKKGRRIKAILVMHTYGMPSQMDRLMQIANRWQVPVIEDAAEALGSSYKGKTAGTIGKLGIYSFNTNKIFTTYGGGALLTSEEAIAKRVRFMSAQARENLPYYEHREQGYNYLMGALNAAYGLSQLPYMQANITERRKTFDTYKNRLSSIEFQPEPEGCFSNRWLSTGLFRDEQTRLRAAKKLADIGIETRPLWKPMHQQPLFAQYPCYEGELSEQLFSRGLCFPVGPQITPEKQQQIIDMILQAIS